MIAPANTPLEASPAPASGSSLNRHRAVVRVLLAAVLAAVALTGLSLGAVPLPSGVVLGLLAQALELPISAEPTEAQAAVLLHIRLPRVILGMLVGGGLAVAGAAMQALFRNPLADPAIIGVSSGAALVAVAVIVLGDTVLQNLHGLLGIWTLPVAAFLGGLGVTALVYRLSWEQGETHMASLLLGGIAINSLAGAATGLLIYMADDAQLRTLTFWAMGSLGGASWVTVLAALPGVQVACLVIVWHAQAAQCLALGRGRGQASGHRCGAGEARVDCGLCPRRRDRGRGVRRHWLRGTGGPASRAAFTRPRPPLLPAGLRAHRICPSHRGRPRRPDARGPGGAAHRDPDRTPRRTLFPVAAATQTQWRRRMLEAIFATLSLGGRRILDRVSVQVNAGEVVALIGPNGAGKSTLLKVLSGELKVERGRVALHGCPLGAWKHRELARYRAVLPQGARLDFSFSVLEVVLLGRSPHLVLLPRNSYTPQAVKGLPA